MDIQGLTAAMHDFVRSQGWYEADSRRPQTLRARARRRPARAATVLIVPKSGARDLHNGGRCSECALSAVAAERRARQAPAACTAAAMVLPLRQTSPLVLHATRTRAVSGCTDPVGAAALCLARCLPRLFAGVG